MRSIPFHQHCQRGSARADRDPQRARPSRPGRPCPTHLSPCPPHTTATRSPTRTPRDRSAGRRGGGPPSTHPLSSVPTCRNSSTRGHTSAPAAPAASQPRRGKDGDGHGRPSSLAVPGTRTLPPAFRAASRPLWTTPLTADPPVTADPARPADSLPRWGWLGHANAHAAAGRAWASGAPRLWVVGFVARPRGVRLLRATCARGDPLSWAPTGNRQLPFLCPTQDAVGVAGSIAANLLQLIWSSNTHFYLLTHSWLVTQPANISTFLCVLSSLPLEMIAMDCNGLTLKLDYPTWSALWNSCSHSHRHWSGQQLHTWKSNSEKHIPRILPLELDRQITREIRHARYL